MSTNTRHPIQPLILDSHGVLRFKKNPLVDMLLEHGQRTGLGLNELARVEAAPEDRMQLAQLIGYSLEGYGSLGYVTDDEYKAAAAMHDDELSEDKARIAVLETELIALRAALREPMARLFGVHPDDLGRS
jgi:hypothetical protein